MTTVAAYGVATMLSELRLKIALMRRHYHRMSTSSFRSLPERQDDADLVADLDALTITTGDGTLTIHFGPDVRDSFYLHKALVECVGSAADAVPEFRPHRITYTVGTLSVTVATPGSEAWWPVCGQVGPRIGDDAPRCINPQDHEREHPAHSSWHHEIKQWSS